MHVPKVMQHERQHHFHVEAAALMATFRLCSLHYGKLTDSELSLDPQKSA